MPTSVSPDDMKSKVLLHFEDFVNNRKAEVIQINMTPDFLDHDGPGGQEVGITEDEKMMRMMYDKMPDLRIDVQFMIAEGDMVVCRNIWTWKSAETGEKMEFHGFVQWRFEGTRIAERWAAVTSPMTDLGHWSD